MAVISMPYVFVPATTIISSQVNANFATIVTLVNGQIDNSNISTTANIAISKLGLNPGGAAFNKTTTGNQTWGSGLTTDTIPQVVMFSDKGLQFGPGGAAALDVRLKRTAAVTLTLDTPAGAPAIFNMAGGQILNPHTITMDNNTSTLDMAGGSIINVGSLSGPNPANAAVNGLRVSTSSTLAIAPNATAITTLYLLPYLSGLIGLWNGTGWALSDLSAGLNVAVPATTSTSYDIAVDYNGGVPALVAFQWVGANTPPAGRGVQNGVPYTNGNARYRLVAVMQTGTVAGQTSHTPAERFVINIYNTIQLSLGAQIPVASWTYNVATLRASNANVTNGQGRVAFMTPFANMGGDFTFTQPYSTATAAATVASAQNAIGLDSTTAAISSVSSTTNTVSGATIAPGGVNVSSVGLSNLTAGQHFVQMLESSDASAKTWTFYGNGATISHALTGTIMG